MRLGSQHKEAKGTAPRIPTQALQRLGYTVQGVLKQDKPNVLLLLGDYKSQHKASARVVIKVIEYANDDMRQQAQRELSALRCTSCPKPSPYVVPVLRAMEGEKRLFIVMPYIGGGDLCDLVMQHEDGLPEEEARRCFTHICKGLRHLKRAGVAHGDISLENVVLSHREQREGFLPLRGQTSRAHLIDLGSARMGGACSAATYVYVGKPGNVPPEVVYGRKDGVVDPYCVDVWGLGVSLYTLLTGRRLYDGPSGGAFVWLAGGQSVEEMLQHQEHTFGLRVMSAHARQLVAMLLQTDPSKRPTIEQILEHPWLTATAAETVQLQ